jgi:hydrogenase expression/formation protein HypC
MCLALPAKIIEKNDSDQTGVVELQGNRYPANLVMVPEAGLGDWVLVHAGYAIKVVDADEAKETWDLLDQMLEPGDRQGTR